MQREVLLWNFTVLGEASAQLDDEFKKRYPHIDWARPNTVTQPDHPRLLVRRP